MNGKIKYKNISSWIVLIVVMNMVVCYGQSPVVSIAQDGINERIISNDGAWCWFQDPRAVYVDGEYERTYAQWMTHDGKLQVGSVDHKTGKIEKYTLKENWDSDDHNVGSFLVLDDNRLMAFYAQHNKTGIFCRTTVNPEDIGQWGEEVTISNSPFVTYAHPVYLSNEKMYYVFWRGSTWKPTFSTSTDGKSWSKPLVLIQDKGMESKDIRPYTKIISDGISSIHIAFTDGHPAHLKNNSLYYLKYENGQFFKADGSVIGSMNSIPVSHSKSDMIFDSKATNILSWVWDIALDDQGYPVIAYTQFQSKTDHRYHYARWNGNNWLDVQITPGGIWFPQEPEIEKQTEPYYSGGIVLDHSNPSRLYLSRPVNGVFEIEKWSTLDNGKSWSSVFLTSNSAYNNVRPVVPHGYNDTKDHVLFMSGAYLHYTDYRTGIKLLEYAE